ncbi:MAG: YIP1 family protein [Gemmatimonadaceae bacterium]
MSLPTDASTKPSGGLMDDLLEIFVKPSAVFERRRDSGFVVPVVVQMLLFVVLAVGLHNLMAPYMDADFARAMAKTAAKAAANGQPMPEQATAMAEKFKNVGGYVIPAVVPWLVAIIGGIFVWLFAKIVGAKLQVGQGMTIAAWSFFPAILAMVVVAVFGVIADPQTVRGMSDAQLGPARFVDPATVSPILLQFLMRLDVFNIWSVILTGIGISVVGRVSRTAGIGAAVIQWVVVALVFGACASLGQ